MTEHIIGKCSSVRSTLDLRVSLSGCPISSEVGESNLQAGLPVGTAIRLPHG